MNPIDRHENSRWEFRQEKTGAGVPVRLYRNRADHNLFKRVQKRTSTSSAGWENVEYTIKGKVDADGEQVWVHKLANLAAEIELRIQRSHEAKEIRRQLYGS